MNLQEFSVKLAEATKDMSEEERASLVKMFESISDEFSNNNDRSTKDVVIDYEGSEIPNGITERLAKLKEKYLTHTPTITTHRARAITKIAKENPGMPKILLRAKCFKYC